MTAPPRLLFPTLPPELRNQVFEELSTVDNTSPATTFGLPFQVKKYESKHTTVQICAVHYGSEGLLALHEYRFQEAGEFQSWLIHNAIELRIGVTFTGRVNTFVQANWDQKMTLHLHKLAKQYPWLTKVSRYDIQIHFAPTDGELKSKRNMRLAAQIPRDMVQTLTMLMDERIAINRGHVNACLSLHYMLALENTYWTTKLGLAAFFSAPFPSATPSPTIKTLIKNVSVVPLPALFRPPRPGRRLIDVPSTQENKDMLLIQGSRVTWKAAQIGCLVMSKTYISGPKSGTHVDNATVITTVGDPPPATDTQNAHIHKELFYECMGYR